MATAAAPSGATKPRLMILKMEAENFKSYGGVKEIGPFHKSFTAVVGPNGSGKSNVIDAMLFVFGKKTAKLRLNKLSELIHKSAEYPSLDHARVTVFFQDILDAEGVGDEYTVVPGSQFTVTRTASRDNSSKYYVNGKSSSFTEVTALLKGKGIDLDNNRFLILQGEVELISQMKPKAPSPHEDGLLEYLEDIIGSNTYVERIAEQAKIVEELTEQRQDRIKRVHVAQKDKDGLESAKLEAEALLFKDRELIRQNGLIAQKVLMQTNDALTEAQAKHAAAAAAAAAQTAALSTVLAQADAAEKAEAAAVKEVTSATEAVASARRAYSDAEKKDAALREDIKAARQTMSKASDTLKRESARLEEAKRLGEAAAAVVPRLTVLEAKLRSEHSKEAADRESVMQSLRGETEQLRKVMEAKQEALTPASEAAASASSALDTARTELRLLRTRAEAGAKDLAGLQARLAAITADSSAKTAEKAALIKEVAAARARKAAAESELAATLAAEGGLGDAARNARSALEEARAAIAAEGGGAAGTATLVERLRSACVKKTGPLAGVAFLGRLGDLASIDVTYDAAVTTAVSGLSSLVVETVAGAQACVAYLRANALGRARFIILEKLGATEAEMRASAGRTWPDGARRLFDLLTPAVPRVLPALYFAMGNTLVAPDLDTANRLAFHAGGRNRVVTLAGELFETSGTMAGGGGKARRGGMTISGTPAAAAAAKAAAAGSSSAPTPEALAALEATAASTATALSECRARKSSLIAEGRDLDKRIASITQRIAKLELEVVALVQMAEDVGAQGSAASKREAAAAGAAAAGGDAAAVAEAEARVASLNAANTKASTTAIALESEVAELQRQIIATGGERVARAQARLDRATEALDACVRDLTKARTDVSSNEKAATKAAAAVAKSEVETAAASATVTKATADVRALENEAFEQLQLLQRSQATLTAAELTAAQARGSLDSISREVKSARASCSAAKLEAEKLLNDCSEGRKAADVWAKRWEKLTEEYVANVDALITETRLAMMDMGELGKEGGGGGNGGAGAGVGDGAMEGTGFTEEEVRVRVLANIKEPLTLSVLSRDALAALSRDKLEAGLAALDADRKELVKKANLSAIAEFRAKEKEFLKRCAELEAVSSGREAARRSYEQLRKARLDTFMGGFSAITLRLKEMYQMITLGGDAELELVDSLDPFSEGIVFSVRPPKKSWKNIANLSGGEKTLSSLALVFALHHYKPTPLYVMDEIDAALDFKNVSIVANYVNERTKDAQFIIISLRNNMFELADRLVGIYKTSDVTKSVTINPKAIAAACGLVPAEATMGGAAAMRAAGTVVGNAAGL